MHALTEAVRSRTHGFSELNAKIPLKPVFIFHIIYLNYNCYLKAFLLTDRSVIQI